MPLTADRPTRPPKPVPTVPEAVGWLTHLEREIAVARRLVKVARLAEKMDDLGTPRPFVAPVAALPHGGDRE